MKEKKDINLQRHASLYENKLSIGVENLGDLQSLIKDVQEKEKALQNAVHRLELFNLEILFMNK